MAGARSPVCCERGPEPCMHVCTRRLVALGQRQGDQESQRGDTLQTVYSLCSLGMTKTTWGVKELTTRQAPQASRRLYNL